MGRSLHWREGRSIKSEQRLGNEGFIPRELEDRVGNPPAGTFQVCIGPATGDDSGVALIAMVSPVDQPTMFDHRRPYESAVVLPDK